MVIFYQFDVSLTLFFHIRQKRKSPSLPWNSSNQQFVHAQNSPRTHFNFKSPCFTHKITDFHGEITLVAHAFWVYLTLEILQQTPSDHGSFQLLGVDEHRQTIHAHAIDRVQRRGRQRELHEAAETLLLDPPRTGARKGWDQVGKITEVYGIIMG